MLLRIQFCVLALLFVLCCINAKKPNIVFIIADDQDVASGTMDYMPNVRSLLGEQGLSFNNAFTTTPLCGPARASILRSQYTHNHPVKSNNATHGYLAFKSVENDTLPVWLKKSGYTTALFGKYFNGYGLAGADIGETHPIGDYSVPEGWDEWFATIRGRYFNPIFSRNGKIYHSHQGDETAQEYHTDVISQEVNSFISRHFRKNRSDPVFMYIGVKAPHDPYTPAPRHAGSFSNYTHFRPPNFNPPDKFQALKPSVLSNHPRMWPPYTDEMQQKRLESLQAVDELVRDVVKNLEEVGVLDNTYIFYTSDHGFSLGQHRITLEKSQSYEHCLRIPLYVRGPGIPPNTLSKEVALNIDFAPTLTELAGGETPEWVDGRSFSRSLFGKKVYPVREAFLVENFEPPGGKIRIFDWTQGVRILSKNEKINLLYNVWNEKENECYDVNDDPYQLNNGCKNVTLSQIIGEANPQWYDILNCSGQSCRDINLDSLQFLLNSKLNLPLLV